MVWQALCRETDSMHLLPTDPCYCCVVFLDGEYKEKDVTVEAQKTVKGPYPDTEQRSVPHASARHLCRLHLQGRLRADQ